MQYTGVTGGKLKCLPCIEQPFNKHIAFGGASRENRVSGYFLPIKVVILNTLGGMISSLANGVTHLNSEVPWVRRSTSPIGHWSEVPLIRRAIGPKAISPNYIVAL